MDDMPHAAPFTNLSLSGQVNATRAGMYAELEKMTEVSSFGDVVCGPYAASLGVCG
jgi:hypothetical protein